MAKIDDPAALRALAHPLRLRLLAALRIHGPATASQLGRRLGESSGSTSYHLRSLARHGFVEDAEHANGNGRERWWQAAHDATEWQITGEEPAETEAARGLTRLVVLEHARWMHAYLDDLHGWNRRWRAAGTFSDRFKTLTPERLTQLDAEVAELIERYAEDDPGTPDAERVMILFSAFPQREDAS